MSKQRHPQTVPKPARNRRAVWLAAVVGLAAVIAVPTYLFWTPDDPDDEPFEMIRKSGTMHDVVINTGELTPSMLFKVADELCGQIEVCDIRYWYDEKKIPPMNSHVIRGEDALYARNRPQRIEMIVKDGREFRR